MRPLTNAEKRLPQLIEAYRKLRNLTAAARAVKMCRSKAVKLLQDAGECVPRSEVWQRRLPELRELHEAGATHAEMAAHFGLSKAAIFEACKRYLSGSNGNNVPSPESHRVFGRVGDSADALSARIARYIGTLGAATVVCSQRGIITAAIPGSRVAVAAERGGRVVATYATEPRNPRHRMTAAQLRSAIREDLEHEIGGINASAR